MKTDKNESAIRLWDKTDVARYLGVSVRQISTLVSRGDLPFIKLGKSGAKRVPVRFIPDQVMKAVQKQFQQ